MRPTITPNPTYFHNFHPFFQHLACPGQAVITASGDNGVLSILYTRLSMHQSVQIKNISSFPLRVSLPYSVACIFRKSDIFCVLYPLLTQHIPSWKNTHINFCSKLTIITSVNVKPSAPTVKNAASQRRILWHLAGRLSDHGSRSSRSFAAMIPSAFISPGILSKRYFK